MFPLKAVQASRFILCSLGAVALAVSLTPKIFALTNHAPTNVFCQIVSPEGDFNSVVNPSSSNPAVMSGNNNTFDTSGAEAQCTWTGFASGGTAVAGDTITFTASVTSGSACAGDRIHNGSISVVGNGFWRSQSTSGSTVSFNIIPGSDLSKLTVIGTALAGANSGCTVELDVTSLHATF